jgi:hypothetical protein
LLSIVFIYLSLSEIITMTTRRIACALALAGAMLGSLAIATPANARPVKVCNKVRVGHHFETRCHTVRHR